jgi:glutamate-1-semialdehyde 2,1-aminomutase
VTFERSKRLQQRSHSLIPGGAHTYAKGDDQYPERAPGFIVCGKGCHVWDVDGNEFIEYGMGLRSVTLGHGWPSVVKAACREMERGINFTRPSPLEVECAEQLARMVPSADMVKFAKNGSDVTTAAVRLARAHTGRDMVAICGDHPFFSVDDWFIGTSEMHAGIPQSIRDLTVTFHYNDLASIERLFATYPNRIACIVLEAERTEPPKDNFLRRALDLCHRHGALFVLDEIITGFRWHNGGAQVVHGVAPDLSAFGKGMGNGFSIAALVGRREIMELGGLSHKRERVFLLSTTYGAETPGLAAALETMRTYEREPVVEHLRRQGERLRRGVEQVVLAKGLMDRVGVDGHPANLTYYTHDENGEPSQPFRTLFLQELIAGGVIAPSLVVSYSHRDEDIDRTIEAIDRALDVYARALSDGLERYLAGRSVQPVMRKFC